MWCGSGYDYTGAPGLLPGKRQGGLPGARPGGAGDIFGGSAVAKLLALDTPPAELEPGALEGIARFAVTAASLSTLRPGGISSIPTEAEVLAALEE